MAELTRSLRTLKAPQAEQAAVAGPALEAPPQRPPARRPVAHRPQPNEPGPHRPEPRAERRVDDVLPKPPAPGPTLHEAAAPWMPIDPGTGPGQHAMSAPEPRRLLRNRPELRGPDEPETPTKSDQNDRPRRHRPPLGMRATEPQGRMDRLNKCGASG
jgi:hypothetical protein